MRLLQCALLSACYHSCSSGAFVALSLPLPLCTVGGIPDSTWSRRVHVGGLARCSLLTALRGGSSSDTSSFVCDPSGIFPSHCHSLPQVRLRSRGPDMRGHGWIRNFDARIMICTVYVLRTCVVT
jgi:hypothetical protein